MIQLNYVKSKMLVNNIGYLRLTQFGQDVTKDVEKSLKKLSKQGMKALVFDLRSNPGGSLEEAIKIGSLFVKEDKIVLIATHDPVLALMGERRIIISNGGISQVIETTEDEREVLGELERMDKFIQDMRTKLRYGKKLNLGGANA